MIVSNLPMPTEIVARHYNELDEFYREVWGEHVHHGLWQTGRETPKQATEQLVHMVAERAGIRAGSHVCDVGCGYGGTSRLLASEYLAELTGLTVSEVQFRYASQQASGKKNPQFQLCPWEHNTFAADSFDAVVSIECVSHVVDKPEFYRQIYRVLRPEKKAVVIAWLANPQAGCTAVRHLLEPICREGRLPGLATADEYSAMIRDAGLVLENFEEISRQVRKTWSICARRLLWKLLTRVKYITVLLSPGKSNRIFVLTLFRILIAYRTGSMQYGVFTISKPAAPAGSKDVEPTLQVTA
ncbi:MAG: class I SAM-dependent methyltransferase [Planctomycetota bacterium]|nr:class I SAM-dependent methyltransferase [Planctomycetota bacterium]